jgi:hypothetical protein
MLRIYGIEPGSKALLVTLVTGGHRFTMAIPDQRMQYRQINAVKGDISTTPSCASNFNDCSHIELYGNIFLKTTYRDRYGQIQELTPGFTYQRRYAEPPTGVHLVYSDSWTAYGMEAVFFSSPEHQNKYSGSITWILLREREFGSFSHHARDLKYHEIDNWLAEQRSWFLENVEFVREAASWHRPNYEVVCGAFQFSNSILDLAKLWMRSSTASCSAPSLLAESENELLQTALNSTQEIPTLSVACQLGFDGLVMQALSGMFAEVPSLATLTSFKEVLQKVGKLDLAYQWGVEAPISDYMTIFKSLDKWYGGRIINGKPVNNGLQPFFWKASVSRKTVDDNGWTVRLVTGIQWDYLKGSSVEDFFGIIHSAGLEITLNQAWDLVPGSFAVDWLVNVSGILDQLDAILNSWRYPIQYYWHSFLAERYITILGQRVQVKWYERNALPRLPKIRLNVSWDTLRGTLSSRNAGTALAFLVQFF